MRSRIAETVMLRPKTAKIALLVAILAVIGLLITRL
jgi:hypothetical protein